MDFIQQFISEELIYALGWTVVHSIWQGLLVAIIMALVMQSMQKSSAKLRYEVASISLFLVFVFSFSTFILLYDGISQKEFGEITLIGHASSENAALTGSFFQSTVQTCIDYFNNHLSLIVVIWLIGVTFFLLRLVGGLTYVQIIKYRNNQPLPAYWQKKLAALTARIPLRKPVELLESSMVKIPMVIGYFKPIILLPVGAVNNLTESEVEAILAHELGHIFRNDFLMNIVLSFIEVLFYYHPAVWWISGNVRLERENCSDDIAIKLCGNSLTYAKALVTLQEMNQHPVPSFAMTFSGRKNQLLNRIKRILNQPQNRSNILEKLTATCLLLAAIFILSVGANAPFDGISESKKNEKEEPTLHFFPETQVRTNVLVDITMSNDTVPERRRKEVYRVIKEENGEKMEFTMENGEIVELKVNGENIPKEEFENYEDMVDEMILDVPAPPAPPAPPSPVAAPHPPSPPATPNPPTAPKAYFYEVKSQNIQTVTKGKNDKGQTIIVITTEEGKEPMEIVIEKEGKMIFIDGNELEDGDTAIIIDEHDHRQGFMNVFPDMPACISSSNAAKLESEAVLAWAEAEKMAGIQAFENGYGGLALRFDEDQMQKLKADQKRALQLYEKQLKVYSGDLKNQSLEIQKLDELRMKELEAQAWELQKERNNSTLYYFDQGSGKAYSEDNGLFYKSENVSSRIENELIKDGLIESGSDYKLELDGKSMKVNGKKVSGEVYEKYKKLYEGYSNNKMNKNSDFFINKNED